MYYNELINYFDRSEIAIIFSTGSYEEGEKYELYKDHYKEDAERKKLIKQFKRRITEEEQKMGNNLKGKQRKVIRSKATGKIHDANMYGLLKEDWKKARPKLIKQMRKKLN